SRAEHRLYLREDNADTRLTAKGREVGSVGDADFDKFRQRQEGVETLSQLIQTLSIDDRRIPETLLTSGDNRGTKLAAILRRPQASIFALAEAFPEMARFPKAVQRKV